MPTPRHAARASTDTTQMMSTIGLAEAGISAWEPSPQGGVLEKIAKKDPPMHISKELYRVLIIWGLDKGHGCGRHVSPPPGKG
ncbi:hypothetical protein WA026_015542 [Henosepilachna vigintioctopunctata]|uniref:Uncharacterized protein n=1 Tax=Henosepilachna vigintioctopunctata TaxID=420089 RepID=A0AAW1VDD9_9CUCU